jgi:hypothetical protein
MTDILGMAEEEQATATATAGPSTARLAMRLRDASLRMTDFGLMSVCCEATAKQRQSNGKTTVKQR